MKCFTCKTEMECVDDVNQEHIRIDWFQCPKCGSKATMIYQGNRGYVTEVKWER